MHARCTHLEMPLCMNMSVPGIARMWMARSYLSEDFGQLCTVVNAALPGGSLKGKFPGSCRLPALCHWRKLVEVTYKNRKKKTVLLGVDGERSSW